jgi:hypothetical protein
MRMVLFIAFIIFIQVNKILCESKFGKINEMILF